jgi:hypothetical protein
MSRCPSAGILGAGIACESADMAIASPYLDAQQYDFEPASARKRAKHDQKRHALCSHLTLT